MIHKFSQLKISLHISEPLSKWYKEHVSLLNLIDEAFSYCHSLDMIMRLTWLFFSHLTSGTGRPILLQARSTRVLTIPTTCLGPSSMLGGTVGNNSILNARSSQVTSKLMLYMQRFFILSTFGSSGIPFYQGVISNYMLIKS